MSNMSHGSFAPDAAVPQAVLTQVSRVLDSAQRAINEQRASITALTAKNVELMIAVLDRDRQIRELQMELRQLQEGREPTEAVQHERAAA